MVHCTTAAARPCICVRVVMFVFMCMRGFVCACASVGSHKHFVHPRCVLNIHDGCSTQQKSSSLVTVITDLLIDGT